MFTICCRNEDPRDIRSRVTEDATAGVGAQFKLSEAMRGPGEGYRHVIIHVAKG